MNLHAKGDTVLGVCDVLYGCIRNKYGPGMGIIQKWLKRLSHFICALAANVVWDRKHVFTWSLKATINPVLVAHISKLNHKHFRQYEHQTIFIGVYYVWFTFSFFSKRKSVGDASQHSPQFPKLGTVREHDWTHVVDRPLIKRTKF